MEAKQPADVIQLISLSIEVIGFSLAFIELFHGEVADRIEKALDALESRILQKAQKFLNSAKEYFFYGGKVVYWIIFVAFGVYAVVHNFGTLQDGLGVSAPEIIDSIESMDEGLKPVRDKAKIPLIIIIFLVMSPALVLIALFVLLKSGNLFIKFLNNVAHGKALGAFGFLLTAIALIGELTQVLLLTISGEAGWVYLITQALLIGLVIFGFCYFKSLTTKN